MAAALAVSVIRMTAAKKLPAIAACLGLTATVLLSTVTMKRTEYWRNDEALFNREAEINPKSLLAQIFLGIIQKDSGHWEQALPYFMQAIELNPESGLAAKHAGDCHQELNNYHQAENFYRRAISAQVLNTAEPFQDLSILLYSNGKVAEAKAVLLEGIKSFPEEPLLHMDLASIYYNNEQDYAVASKHYSLVMKLTPRLLDAKLGNALCLIKLGNTKEAKRLISELKKAQPKRYGHLTL